MNEIAAELARIAAALERLAPPAPARIDLSAAGAFVWRAGALQPVARPARLPIDLLVGIDAQKALLLANTARFAAGGPANNALLWGARGTGKSALVKAVHAAVAADHPALKIVEVASADLPGLSGVAGALADGGSRVILYVDDLSFDGDEAGLKALKPALDGGLAGRPGNVIVYATSNRRHLIARDPRENLATDLHWSDTAEDRLALSDRFGLSLGFHALDEEEYLAIVAAYAKRIGLPAPSQETEARARIWALDRGARSGRTAWQFIVAAAAEAGVALDF